MLSRTDDRRRPARSSAGRPTLKTLATHLDLSVTTVSRALKDAPEVTAETIARVKEAAAEIGYVPNLRGIKLRTGRTFNICGLLAAPPAEAVGDAGSLAITQGLHDTLRATQYSLTTVPLVPGMDALAEMQRLAEAELADAFIFDLTRPQDERARYLLEQGIPFVSFGRTELFTPHAYFDIDNEDAAYQATALLLRRGHRRIGLVDPPLDFLYGRQRLTGYQRALAEAGVPLETDIVSHGVHDAPHSKAVAGAMLALPRPPTAFACANEVSTLGTIAALVEAGRTIGDGIDLVSRDGTRLVDFLPWPISSCFYSLTEVGRRLASAALALIDGADPADYQTVVRADVIEQ